MSTRDKISGFNIPSSPTDEAAYNAANKAGWSKGFDGSDSPDYGNAPENQPKPKTVDGNSKSDCYGE